MRLLGLLHFRDEERFLPGWLANVLPQVDGVIALDHGSCDGSRELLAGRSELRELVELPREEPFHEGRQFRLMIETARRHHPDWLICVDADERLEHGFRERAERAIARAAKPAPNAYRVHVRELWDGADQVRVDGVFGRKNKVPLFRVLSDHAFDDRPLHASLACTRSARVGTLDAIVYHLAMLRPEDRLARFERYRRRDAANRWQRTGYDYMLDVDGLKVEPVSAGRGYE